MFSWGYALLFSQNLGQTVLFPRHLMWLLHQTVTTLHSQCLPPLFSLFSLLSPLILLADSWGLKVQFKRYGLDFSFKLLKTELVFSTEFEETAVLVLCPICLCNVL